MLEKWEVRDGGAARLLGPGKAPAEHTPALEGRAWNTVAMKRQKTDLKGRLSQVCVLPTPP